MCLDHGAHGLRTEHPIFRGPLPVELAYEDTPTPSNYRDHLAGEKLGPTIPVWRVQVKGFNDKVPGLVSDPTGFLDSPDTEFIASGINTKGPDSVAIGRHGHLVLWGFYAPPSGLTDSAKNALVNTVAWTSQFDRAPRLVSQVAQHRESFAEFLHYVRDLRGFYDKNQKEIAEYVERARSLREAGKTRKLTADEQAVADQYESLAQAALPPFEEWSKSMFDSFDEALVARCGIDVACYAAWYNENREYLIGKERFGFVVDEHAKRLGLPNRELGSLSKAIELLSVDAAKADALAFLQRYTGQQLTEAAAFREWLKTHGERLFFSDVGGYRWFERPATPAAAMPSKPAPSKKAG
jgi:hypothetical protein